MTTEKIVEIHARATLHNGIPDKKTVIVIRDEFVYEGWESE
ncbi:MAG: hypothetical protein OEQ39_06820 [Gammaproteobacteria bacterium]|nr:hypothetical protein [Gammaproteobacteria bacterium]MDH3467213.1 hypothetical protein [Gammaproteobacteria bacterium]